MIDFQRWRAAWALVGVLLLSACTTVGPDYTPPAPPALENADLAYASPPAGESAELDADPLPGWWRQFRDARLEGLIQLALANNTSVAVAEQRLNQALAVFTTVEDEGRPSLSLDSSYRYVDSRDIASGQRAEFEEFALGGRAGWELDLFGRVARATEAARADAEAAAARWQAVKLGLVASVSGLYGDWVVSQAQLELARQNRESLWQTLALVDRRADEGLVTGFDPLALRAEIAGLDAELPDLAHDIERTRNVLAALIGIEPRALPVLEDGDLPQAQTDLALADPLAVFRERADIQVAERQLAAATASVGVAMADFYPRVRLDGFVGFLAGSPGALLESGSKAIDAGPSLSWLLFDWSAIEARVNITESDVQIAALRYRQVFLDALTETRNAFDRHRQAQRATLLRAVQVDESTQARRLAQQQYQEGYIDLIALLEAERSVFQARRAQLAADLRVFQGIVAIYDALGGGVSG